MALIRTTFWNGIAVAIRMGSALVLNKILAIYVGPAGYAVIGQFQNAVTMAVTFGTAALGTGVTKYTAEHFDEPARQAALWQTAGTVTLLTSIVAAIAITIFRVPLAGFFLNDVRLSSVFLWLAVSLVFVSLNSLLLAMLNGKKELRRYLVSNVAGSLVALALTGVLSWRLGLYGALVALSVNQAIVFFVTLQQISGTGWFRMKNVFGRIDSLNLRRLGGYVAMAATTAAVVPSSQILVRNHLAGTFGWDYAGYWDAMWRISSLFLTFVTTTLTLYYLPRISELGSNAEVRREISQVARFVMPLVLLGSLVLYLLRNWVVRLLFTDDFLPMADLFAWQLAGDVIKIGSWLISFVMLGKAMIRLFIVTEVVFALLFWVLTIACTYVFGFQGVAIAHLGTYTIYFCVMWYFIVFRHLRGGAAIR